MKIASSPQGLVLAERDGSVLRLTLNRPERLNAVSEALYAALLDYAAMAEDDRDIRCVLLTGAGRAFCAGADLKAHGTRERTGDELKAYVGLGQRVCARIQHLTVPVVAAVREYALGAGAELAVSADFLVIAGDAQMGFPEADDLLAVMGTADWAEDVAAFAARRTPVFQGR